MYKLKKIELHHCKARQRPTNFSCKYFSLFHLLLFKRFLNRFFSKKLVQSLNIRLSTQKKYMFFILIYILICRRPSETCLKSGGGYFNYLPCQPNTCPNKFKKRRYMFPNSYRDQEFVSPGYVNFAYGTTKCREIATAGSKEERNKASCFEFRSLGHDFATREKNCMQIEMHSKLPSRLVERIAYLQILTT